MVPKSPPSEVNDMDSALTRWLELTVSLDIFLDHKGLARLDRVADEVLLRCQHEASQRQVPLTVALTTVPPPASQTTIVSPG